MTGERPLRKATAEDIARLVAHANHPLSENAILSGAGLGDAQIDIPAAFSEAIDAGLIVVHHAERGQLHMPRVFYVPAQGTS